MKTETQNIILIGVIIIVLAFIIKNQFTIAEAITIGLIGYLAPKTLTDKQSETLEKQILEENSEGENKL